MNDQPTDHSSPAFAQWQALLQNTAALLESPIKHHRELLQRAYGMYTAQVIDEGELSDFLELADAAYAYAIESVLDRISEC